MDTLTLAKTQIRASEAPPVTLQVVLRGSDGVVIASDRLVSSQPELIGFTDLSSKMVVKSRFVCTFAGDDCAKYISTRLVEKVGDSAFENSGQFIEAVNSALDEYKGGRWSFPETGYRKILWVQSEHAAFTIWVATYWACTQNFELSDNPDSVVAGHDANPARYFVEHYFKKNPPLKTVSGLKKMAAHVILTGHIFNPAGVDGLEMVFGDRNGFSRVRSEEIQELEKSSHEVHEKNDSYFRD